MTAVILDSAPLSAPFFLLSPQNSRSILCCVFPGRGLASAVSPGARGPGVETTSGNSYLGPELPTAAECPGCSVAFGRAASGPVDGGAHPYFLTPCSAYVSASSGVQAEGECAGRHLYLLLNIWLSPRCVSRAHLPPGSVHDLRRLPNSGTCVWTLSCSFARPPMSVPCRLRLGTRGVWGASCLPGCALGHWPPSRAVLGYRC